jgi:hypothetical protein
MTSFASSFSHFVGPAGCSGSVLPSFNAFFAVGIKKHQLIAVLNSHFRYFVEKGICIKGVCTKGICGSIHKDIFRNCLGGAGGLA